jgi:hypothetical protein
MLVQAAGSYWQAAASPRPSIYPCLSHAHHSHSLVSCTSPASFLVVSPLLIRASQLALLWLLVARSTYPPYHSRPQRALTMAVAAAARLLLLRLVVLALLAAAQQVVGKSAVLSLRELDGRRRSAATTDTRSSRYYVDAKLAETLGTVQFMTYVRAGAIGFLSSDPCVTETFACIWSSQSKSSCFTGRVYCPR